MDFTQDGNYTFDPLYVDSSIEPIVNFSENDEYPKRYVVTRNPNPIKKGEAREKYVVMDNAELKQLRGQVGLPIYSKNITDYYSPYKYNTNVEKDSYVTDRENRMVRGSNESFTNDITNSLNSLNNLMNNDSMFHMFLIIMIIVFAVLATQLFSLYSNNLLLKTLIKSKGGIKEPVVITPTLSQSVPTVSSV